MIDLILTNCGSSFIKAPVLETGISGYHNMFSVFSNIVSLRDWPKIFATEILKTLIKKRFTWNLKCESVRILLKNFRKSFWHLQLLAPSKKNICCNNKKFMTKSLRTTIMVRSDVRNKSKNTEHKKVSNKKETNALIF